MRVSDPTRGEGGGVEDTRKYRVSLVRFVKPEKRLQSKNLYVCPIGNASRE